jgi:hypothetical protein
MRNRVTKLLCGLVVLATACLLGGCSTYTNRSDRFVQPYVAGDLQRAAAEVTAQAGTVDAADKTLDEQAKAADRDILLLRLEQAAVYRLAADYQRSNLALEHARQLVDRFDEKARVRLGEGAAVLVTNLTAVEYRGQLFDRVMLYVYRAMNYLEAGNIEAARPELLAAYERQREAVEKYAKRIEAEREKAIRDGSAAQKGSSGATKADVNRTIASPEVQARLGTVYGELNEMAAYESYVNPFAEYLQGLYFLHAAVDGSDLERARVALRKTSGLVPSNEVVAQDAALADTMAAGATAPPLTYIIFETGLAPRREEVRIDIPIFLFNIVASDTQVDYVGASFPKLVKEWDFTPHLLVATPEGTIQTRVVADMDGIIAREFQNELGAVIAKTIAAAATKAALAYGASRATEGNDIANVLVRIASTAYQYAANQADTRTWRTLPKQFQVARIATPENRVVQLSLPNGAMLPAINLIPGQINVIYVRSASSMSPTFVRQFRLK